MTFLTVWFAGIFANVLLLWLMCRGERITYKELVILVIVCLMWPIGILITLSVWFEESGLGKKLEHLEFTMPGGKNK